MSDLFDRGDGGIAAGVAGREGRRDTVTLAEERAHIETLREDRGGRRIRIVTDDHEEMLDAETATESVEVTRHPVGREIDTMPTPREEDGVTIIPVVEERAVVVTRLFLTEEIHIRRTRTTETVTLPVKLRRQRAEIELLDPAEGDVQSR